MSGSVSIGQWEAPIDDSPHVPREVTERCRYKFIAIAGTARPIEGLCADWRLNGPITVVVHALIDTSDRHNGQVIRRRWTLYPEATFISWPVLILPLSPEEAA